MTIHIRKLHKEDIPLLHTMRTGFEHDYILPIAAELMEGDNRLFGLFVDDTLASFAGCSIFAGRYAMLGRLRSDRRFQSNGYATQLMRHMRDLAFQLPEITWVGGYTQENNFSGKRVMEKVDLQPLAVRYGAISSTSLVYGRRFLAITKR